MLFRSLPLELVAQGALGVSEAEEPHDTFLENALAKARHASSATGLPAIADDSGLCVAALGGAPGVHSATYAGEVAVPCGAERTWTRPAPKWPLPSWWRVRPSFSGTRTIFFLAEAVAFEIASGTSRALP